MPKSDIRRAVNFLLDKYGSDAAERATENLDWAMANGNVEETRNWMEVVRLIIRSQENAKAVAQDGRRPTLISGNAGNVPSQSPASYGGRSRPYRQRADDEIAT